MPNGGKNISFRMRNNKENQLVTPLISHPVQGFNGVTSVPGDKSISHRALILGALAVGESVVSGLLEGDDVMATAAALRRLGASIERDSDGRWRVRGVGVGGMRSPGDVLDLGNSGTGARLLAGVIAGQPITAQLTGDASLRARPMDRIVKPLRQMGAAIQGTEGDLLPMTIAGSASPMAIEYRTPVASAQVKSAILLAGLNAPGTTTVIEPRPTRDHTETMLARFGAELDVEEAGGDTVIRLRGQPELVATAVSVAGDPSSAVFPIVAALITRNSRISVANVGLNPLRAGIFETLREMGADLSITERAGNGAEPAGDISARSSRLRGVDIPASRVPSMIDEFPVLAVAAAHAQGITVMRGLAELRLKESDRLAAMAAGLRECGVNVETADDTMVIHGVIDGSGGRAEGGAEIETGKDHRIAMAFLILGMAARRAVRIDDGAMIATSFPGFVDLMNGLGARIEPAPGSGDDRRGGDRS